MVKVFIVDDHDLVRDGIKRILETDEDITIVGEASSGEQAIDKVKALDPDVILMDVKMPGIGGMEATKRLKRIVPKARILAVTSCADEPFPTWAMQAGAMGYVTKTAAADEMLRAVHAVYAGTKYLSTQISQKLALKNIEGSPDAQGKNPFELLSDRELQVCVMVCRGVHPNEIAAQLHLSSKTVNSYRYRIFEKLKISGDIELLHLCMRYGIIEDGM